MRRINIAIDGYAGCGKSTLAKALATALGYTFIDTGAMYRAVASAALAIDSSLSQSAALQALSGISEMRFEGNKLLVNGMEVEHQLRSAAISSAASKVAAVPAVRQKLTQWQRQWVDQKGVVMEGRDIGTVVMPEAEAKFFITATLAERVARRSAQMAAAGESVNEDELAARLTKRDADDASRADAPLALAPNAVVIDTTCLNREEQLKVCLALVMPMMDSKGLLPFVSIQR